MSIRPSSLKIPAIAAAGVFVAYLLLGWLALPRILQSQAEKYVAEKTGHHLTLDRPEFNPLALDLRLANLRLTSPDGKPLLAFRLLDVDLSIASLYRRALVFDAIRLEAPEANVVLQRDGRLNWSALLDALQDKEQKPNSAPPRVDVERFVLTGGRIAFSDDKRGFATRVEPLELDLANVSTLPDDKGQYRLSARIAGGASVAWQGQATLNPLAATGTLGIENFDLARLAPYLKDAVPIAPPTGTAKFATAYRLAYGEGRFDLTLDDIAAGLEGLRLDAGDKSGPIVAVRRIEATGGRFDLGANKLALAALGLADGEVLGPHGKASVKLLSLGALKLDNLQADLAARSVTADGLRLANGRLGAVRGADGHVDVVDVLAAAMRAFAPTKRPDAKPAPAAAPWRYRLNKLALEDFAASFKDETVAPAADFSLNGIAVAVDGISDDLAAPLPVRASCRVRDGGSFEAAGQVVPAAPSADVKLKLADLALKPAQPYLAAVARLTLASGKLGVEGRATYGKGGAAFQGGFAVRDLRLVETGTKDVFLAWRSLASRSLDVTTRRLGVGDLALDGLDTKLIIDQDKSTNLQRILHKPAAGGESAPPPAAAPAQAAPKAPPFVVDIDRLRVSDGEMDFADHSLALPFGTHIHHLRGAVNGLSSRPGTPGQIELDGQVDDYGLARAVGQIDLFDPTGFTDVRVVFRNVEMTRLTPYSATFAGRKIDSGKLSLDLQYKIDKRQLTGENQVVMDQLTLGERVESPEAKNLPLDLAIAILQDSDGRIDLGLPVSGSLDDPQFSYGGIVWKAILNVLGKIATAPFRALGALFGGGEKFENIAFEAGDAQLSPPEREKLARLAGALNKRPSLLLTVHGVYAEADRVALQDRQLRRAVAKRAGQSVDGEDDAGPLSTRSPKVQSALEAMFSDRFGGGELAALKEGFRKANPGQLEEGVAGRMMSRLSGLLREKRALSEQETAQLKGADFHAVLFQRLREKEAVADDQLQALARTRGEGLMKAVNAAGAPGERVALAAPEKVEAVGRDVPLKLDLGAAPKSAPAPQ